MSTHHDNRKRCFSMDKKVLNLITIVFTTRFLRVCPQQDGKPQVNASPNWESNPRCWVFQTNSQTVAISVVLLSAKEDSASWIWFPVRPDVYLWFSNITVCCIPTQARISCITWFSCSIELMLQRRMCVSVSVSVCVCYQGKKTGKIADSTGGSWETMPPTINP